MSTCKGGPERAFHASANLATESNDRRLSSITLNVKIQMSFILLCPIKCKHVTLTVIPYTNEITYTYIYIFSSLSLSLNLAQAQIMLGMVRPNQPNPNIPPPASQQPQQAALPPQQTNVHAALPLPGQTDLKDHIKSGQNHPASMGHSMLRGHEPPRQSLYQGGSPHLGMEFNQTGGPMQAERGSSWIPGLRDNTTGTQNIPGPPSFMAGQMGPASQPPRPPALSSDMESALLQQVMSLTPEQINLLPLEQRNQVLQLQQIWGYFVGMEFNQTGGPMQAERGSSWIPGLRDNTTGTQNIPGPPSFMAGQMGPASQPPRPPALSSDMESALLQQVMSLTPEQINLLPLEQRNQVLQLQQIWGYFVGMEFNQTGGPMQAERGSSWIPGLRDNTTGTQNIPGPPSFMAGQMGPASQPPRPPALSSDMESALLQQVMSLTPEQINLLPLEQRNQVLQLQQIWGYFVGPDNKQRAAVSNLETNGTAATNIADIDAGAALTDRRERELEEELRQKLGRKELEDDEQKLIGGFQHMLSNMYLFSNYVLAVSGGALSLLTKGPQCWMFVTIISFVVIFVIAMVLSLQLTYRQLRALQTKMNSLVEKRNQICPDTKNLELEYESRHCDINLLIFLVVGLMYAGFVLVMGYYLLCSESVNGLSYTPCVPGPHQTVPVESVPDHLLVSPWLPRKFLHQAVPLEPVADHVPFSPCVPSLRPCADM
ncbi:hypothetical protein POM88_054323 [Heracleum sosnowskyi]|uniref:Transcription termination and cleavage factor C-terminal domain-containing protein n=1 Tax=Heracleum sosnowskyi TaxID=360622 RepID=A0AAD8GN01_9APIA|nr:hypothetical protein POM88_054323 [Heracleum sosnowskyi]